MIRILILFALLFFNLRQAACQYSPVNSDLELKTLFLRLSTANGDLARIKINDSIRNIIDEYVHTDTVFHHKFNIRQLGQITSPDSLIKIVTWNLVLENGGGRYFCYLITRGDKKNINLVYSLKSPYKESLVRTDTTYTLSNWYGALYYDLRPYVIAGRRYWVLLGLDYGNPLITRKIIEVMSFNDDGSLVLGRRWFESGENMSYRKVFEYASSGMMTLRFSTDTSIVFDHLVPFSPELINDRRFYGPDYSYDAFILKDGKWIFSLNVDARNKE